MFKNRAYSYLFAKKIKDVLPDGFIKSLQIDRKKFTNKYYKRPDKLSVLARNVFFDFLKLMIEDCIENNHKFVSPNREYFIIYIREKRDTERKRILNRISKVYIDMDIIGSNGKIYEFVLYSKFLRPKSYRTIRIGHHKYRELMRKVNNGKRYFVK